MPRLLFLAALPAAPRLLAATRLAGPPIFLFASAPADSVGWASPRHAVARLLGWVLAVLCGGRTHPPSPLV